MLRQRIVCIVGPTACHKTEYSIALAERTGGEIVSADSVQVYIGMDIGSAKPSIAERRGIPHHLIDCVPIDAPTFSVSAYRAMALRAIDEIASRGKTPIVVGGSGAVRQRSDVSARIRDPAKRGDPHRAGSAV
jgi:tRNA dimethylallyltransferase